MSLFVNCKLLPAAGGPLVEAQLPPLQIRRAALPPGEDIIVPSLQQSIFLNSRMSASFLGAILGEMEGVSLGLHRVTLLTLLRAAFKANPERYNKEVQTQLLASVEALFERDDRIKEEFTLPEGPLRFPLYTVIESLFGHLLAQMGETFMRMTPRSFCGGVNRIRAYYQDPEHRVERLRKYSLSVFGASVLYLPPSNEDGLLIRRDELNTNSPGVLLGIALIMAFEKNDYFVASTLVASEFFQDVPLDLLCSVQNSCAKQCVESPLHWRLLERIAAHPERLIKCSSQMFTLRYAFGSLTPRSDRLFSNRPSHLFAQVLLKRVNDLAALKKLNSRIGAGLNDCLQEGVRHGESELVLRCLGFARQNPDMWTVEGPEDEDGTTPLRKIKDHTHEDYRNTEIYQWANIARLRALARGYTGLSATIAKEYHLPPVSERDRVWTYKERAQ